MTPVPGQIGVLGTLQWPNQPDLTERHPELQSWWRRRYIYLEMALDGAFARPINDMVNLLAAGEWPIVAANTPNGNDVAEFVRSVLTDMRVPWRDVLADALSALGWGWSVQEICWKVRNGRTGTPKSKYDDGMWGIDALEPRRQETMYGWLQCEDGGYNFDQFALTQSHMVMLPKEKILHFTLFSGAAGPEGVGFFRTGYTRWRDVQRYDESLRIGAFRNLAGVPVFRAPAEAVAADPASPIGQAFAAFKNAGATYVRNERTSFVLPEKTAGWDVEILAGNGTGDLMKAVGERRDVAFRELMIVVGAQYLTLAQGGGGGGRALSEDQTELAESVLQGIGERLCEAFNGQVIERLVEVNGFDLGDMPMLAFKPNKNADLSGLASLLKAATEAGMLFPQPSDNQRIRSLADLDPPAEDTGI
jgi:hypothetical protein